MEAYGSYEELLASGVELMQLMRTKREEEEDNRDLFSYNEEDEEYEENGNGQGEGEGAGGVEVRRKSMGGVKDGEMAPVVPTDISPTPHSPHMRNNIDKGESNLSSLLKKPRVHYLGGEDLLQFPPDSASIYSAPSMLSLHSAVESSKHEEEKVKKTVLEHFVKENEDYQDTFQDGFMPTGAAVWSPTRGEEPWQNLSGHLLPLLQSWRQLPRAHHCPPCLPARRGEKANSEGHYM